MICTCFSLHLEAFLTVFKHVLNIFRGFVTCMLGEAKKRKVRRRRNFAAAAAAARYSGGLTVAAGELAAVAEELPTATSRGAY